MEDFLVDTLAYAVREGIPLLIRGTRDGKQAEFAPVRYISAAERIMPLSVGKRTWYPSDDRIVFWIDSGDHTYENRLVMAVAWDPGKDNINFEQVGETMVRHYKSVATKLRSDAVLPVDNLVHVPHSAGDDPAEEVVA